MEQFRFCHPHLAGVTTSARMPLTLPLAFEKSWAAPCRLPICRASKLRRHELNPMCDGGWLALGMLQGAVAGGCRSMGAPAAGVWGRKPRAGSQAGTPPACRSLHRPHLPRLPATCTYTFIHNLTPVPPVCGSCAARRSGKPPGSSRASAWPRCPASGLQGVAAMWGTVVTMEQPSGEACSGSCY